MITMQSMDWVHEGWELRFAIHEGVYHLDHYPLRISHLARTEESNVQAAIATVAAELLEWHMRRGAVPPHAMVLNWSRASRICEGGSTKMTQACQVIDAAPLAETGGCVSNHF